MLIVKYRRFLPVVWFLVFLVAVTLLELLSRPHEPRYTVTDLGVLPGDTVSSASGINNHGDIVGLSDKDLSAAQIFLYRSGRMTRFGPSKFFGGDSGPFINDSGKINRKQRIGSATSPSGYEQSLPHHAFLSSGSRSVDFTMPMGWTTATLRGANGQGQVVGTCYRMIIGSRSRAAFIWDSKTHKFIILPVPHGFWAGGFPEGINDHGQVAGSVWQPGSSRAVLWNATQPVLLEGLPGMNDSTAGAINNHGEMVGSAWSEPNVAAQFVNDHPLRWRLLVPIFRKQWWSRAVVYKGGKAQDLNTLIPSDCDWSLEDAHGINDRGQIVGQGLYHGMERAFLLTPR